MATASVDDVATSLGRPITDSLEEEQVAQWITDAELLIRMRLGALDDLDQEALAYVVREAVILKMRNPEGYQSESIDDYTYRWGSGSGRVAILDEWWDMLQPLGSSTAFSIRAGGVPEYAAPDTWVSTTETL